jgi:hypothetical protein
MTTAGADGDLGEHMSAQLIGRVRRYIAKSPVLQILLFIVITVVVLLVAEYSGLFPA